MGKSLHLLLNGKAKEIALTIPVKKRAEILNNLIVSSLMDQSLFIEIEKILDSETADDVISELPSIGNTKLVRKSTRKTVSKKEVIQKPKKETVSKEIPAEEETSIEEELNNSDSNKLLDEGGFF